MARSTALAGAQLAARQLNCESVFRGMLNYGRGRNNAPAGFVAARPASTTRQLAPFAAREPAPFARSPARPIAGAVRFAASVAKRWHGGLCRQGQARDARS